MLCTCVDVPEPARLITPSAVVKGLVLDNTCTCHIICILFRFRAATTGFVFRSLDLQWYYIKLSKCRLYLFPPDVSNLPDNCRRS